MRTRWVLPLVLSMSLAVGACGDDDDGSDDAGLEEQDGTASTEASVVAAGFVFEPASVEVAVGQTVSWTNDDGVDHTVTAGEPGTPGTGFGEDLPAGGTASVTFTEAGTFPYFCTIHTTMTGEVVVS